MATVHDALTDLLDPLGELHDARGRSQGGSTPRQHRGRFESIAEFAQRISGGAP
jgi:hypothetical protein